MSDSDRIFFDMCVVSILSFQYHPGNDSTRPPDDQAIDRVMQVAKRALLRRNEILGELLWHG